MLLLMTILSLLAFLQFADAFYPWVPAYRCVLDHTCIETRGSEHEADNSFSLKITQRLPENDVPHSEQVNALAARLKGKYSNANRNNLDVSTTVEAENQGGSVMKRTNTYSISTAVKPTQSNSAGIDQDGTDFSYFAEVLLGTDSKPLYMLLDTGASQSWVMGPDCTSQACTTHNSFGASDSTTFEALPDSSFSIGYGSGSVSGLYANDTLDIAGITLPMTIGIANTTSDDFKSFPMDGILGLSQAPGTYPNFINELVASKALTSNLFGVSINRADDGPNNGEINFGAPDTSRFTGSLNYIPVSPSANGDWAIPMDGVGVEGQDAGITGKLAYIDTGTSYIFGPADDVTKFHSLISGSTLKDGSTSTWFVPCTTTTPLTFTFGGTTYSIPSVDWIGPMANGVCTSLLFGQAVIPGQWLLGDTFLKSVYTVFDIDGNRIGFGANSAQPSAVATTEVSSSTGGALSSTAASGTTTAAPASGPTSSVTISNSEATGTTGTLTSQTDTPAMTSGEATSMQTGTPGLNGHQSSDPSTDPSGTATAQSQSTTDPTASPTSYKNSSGRLEASLSAMLLAVLAYGTLI